MKYYIYKLTCAPDGGKSYIGQTTNPAKRFYKSLYRSERMLPAIEKYGWGSFTHEIICETDNLDEANALERKYIEKFNTCNPEFGYNLKLGGDNFSRAGYHRKQSATNKQRKKMKNMRWYYNPETNVGTRILIGDEVPVGYIPGRGKFYKN